VRWPWQRAQVKPVEPRRTFSSKALELQAAMEILAEVFGTQPGEVEEIIRRRLEDRSRPKARTLRSPNRHREGFVS
jgi:hypothetical protein